MRSLEDVKYDIGRWEITAELVAENLEKLNEEYQRVAEHEAIVNDMKQFCSKCGEELEKTRVGGSPDKLVCIHYRSKQRPIINYANK
jgi:hypothetical protein